MIKYDLKDFLGKGWHNIETDGLREWVWSEKEAFLNFPKNNAGFSLYLSRGDVEREILLYDLEIGLIGRYSVGPSLEQIDILPPCSSIKILAPDLSKEIGEERELGVNLQFITSLRSCREIFAVYPIIFEIETTTLCNMKPSCLMCDKSYGLVIDRLYISRVIIDKLNPFLKYARTVSLTGAGEPLLCKTLFDILDSVDSKKTFTQFNSNGLLLTKEMSMNLISKRLGEINFSIDAARAGTYAKIRNKGKFSKLKNNVKQLVMLKEQKNINYPKIVLNMVLMKENIDELPEFIELAHELGAQAVSVKMLKPVDRNLVIKKGDFCFDYQKQMLDIRSPKFKEIILLCKGKAIELGLEFRAADTGGIQELLRPGAPDIQKRCSAPKPICEKAWTDALIGIDGSVKFCCNIHSEGQKQSMAIGNLNNQDFEDIWNGPVAVRMRRQFINGIFPEECSMCSRYDASK